MNDDTDYLPLPIHCVWSECTKQAIIKKWFREAGPREYSLCGTHAERVSELLHLAREHEEHHS